MIRRAMSSRFAGAALLDVAVLALFVFVMLYL